MPVHSQAGCIFLYPGFIINIKDSLIFFTGSQTYFRNDIVYYLVNTYEYILPQNSLIFPV